MNWRRPAISIALSTLPFIAAAAPQDWRLQLLAEQHISAGNAALRALLKDGLATKARFLEVVPQLGAEEFATREQAEKQILRMGKQALPWLDRLPPSDNPEIRFRLDRLANELRLGREWQKAELLHYAAASLLRERNGRPADGDMMFAELFRDECQSLKDRYRLFTFVTKTGLQGKVSDGVLRMSGKGRVEGDQRLVLRARDLTGNDEFPDSFEIEVRLGGSPGGTGSHHVGVSVGKVRALFHPGYKTGGFRFERIDNHKQITSNADMGFDPRTDELQVMNLAVKRLKDGDVQLQANVSQPDDSKSYNSRTRIAPAEIGPLDTIGLDRSGRPGGDAIFDDLTVHWTVPRSR